MRPAPGELITIGEGVIYRVEANQHSALSVMSTGTADALAEDIEEFDLRTSGRPPICSRR